MRAYYEAMAQDALRKIYRRSFLIVLATAAVFVATAVALVMLGPTYTAEANIRVDFESSPSDPNARVQSSVQVEANNVLETIARSIRSRSIAALVVDRLEPRQGPAVYNRSDTGRTVGMASRVPGPAMVSAVQA
ncbi:Wzz/FepE/Etk N-terminal domain-containing protein [Methylobacterium sp. P31]